MEIERKKRGLVLGGGGARGIYEIGAWIALQSCGIHFDIVTGTSIGALVGAMYVQNHLKSVLDFVYHLSPEQIVTDMMDPMENLEEVLANKEALFAFFKSYLKEGMDVTPLRTEIEKMFDYDAFMASQIDFGCMTYSVDRHKGVPFFKEDFLRENAVDILMASASCYPAFPMTTIEEETFIDGGYADNLPVSLALERGAEELYVVDVHGLGFVHKIDTDVCIHKIEPILPLGHILDFSQKQGMLSLELGYLETMKYLGEYSGYIYTFCSEDWPKMYMIEQYLDLMFHNFELDDFDGVLEDILGFRPVRLNNRFTYRYGHLVEALAYICDMDPVRLYNYSEFLDGLKKRLDAIYEKKEDTLYNFYSVLEKNAGKYPLYMDAIRPIWRSSYYLAYVWYFLSVYLKKV